MNTYQGSAWLFAANITTDDILPGQYLDRSNEEVGQFAMAGVDPDFVQKISPGDLIVAGANFGSGSGRETAPIAIKLSGISAIIAPSFARIFFRNSVNIGLPAVIIDSVEEFQNGDGLVLDLSERTVANTRTGNQHPVRNLRGTSLEILLAGGIVPYTKLRLKNEDGTGRSG